MLLWVESWLFFRIDHYRQGDLCQLSKSSKKKKFVQHVNNALRNTFLYFLNIFRNEFQHCLNDDDYKCIFGSIMPFNLFTVNWALITFYAQCNPIFMWKRYWAMSGIKSKHNEERHKKCNDDTMIIISDFMVFPSIAMTVCWSLALFTITSDNCIEYLAPKSTCFSYGACLLLKWKETNTQKTINIIMNTALS